MNFMKSIGVCALVLLSGCTVAQLPAYEPGATVPPGKVLVIAQLELSPAVKQGTISKTHFTIGAPKADEARVYLSPIADIPVDKDAIIPFSLKGASQMNLSFSQPSVISMDPGEQFIRMGEFTLSATTSWRRNPVNEMRGSANIEKLMLWGDLRIDIPETAKAVYIGKLRYEHNGAESRKVTVVDNYNEAMKALKEMNVGISAREVVKRLAKVVRQY